MPKTPLNRRKAPRRRTRLRSGKISTLGNRFLTECLIFDRSASGARVRLAGRMRLPEHIYFFDDERDTLHVAHVVWQKDGQAGLHFATGKGARDGRAHAALSGKYYALRKARRISSAPANAGNG